MQCPNCESDDTKTLKMAYLTETTVSATTGKAKNLQLSFPGGVTMNGGTTRAHSVTRLKLIDEITPPTPLPSLTIALVFIVCGAGILSAVVCRYLGLDLQGAWWRVLLIVISLPLCALAYLAHERMESEYQCRLGDFETTWLCLRCGERWRRK
jgi:hypothetical protein